MWRGRRVALWGVIVYVASTTTRKPTASVYCGCWQQSSSSKETATGRGPFENSGCLLPRTRENSMNSALSRLVLRPTAAMKVGRGGEGDEKAQI